MRPPAPESKTTRSVGVDPGSRETGVVVLDGKKVVDHCVVVRPADDRDRVPGSRYLNEVVDAVADAVTTAGDGSVFGVESVKKPNPHMGLISVTGLLGTAAVLGAVLAVFPQAVLVEPGGHGDGPVKAYPAELRPARGQGKGKDRLRHCRSAYDVALAARIIAGRKRRAS